MPRTYRFFGASREETCAGGLTLSAATGLDIVVFFRHLARVAQAECVMKKDCAMLNCASVQTSALLKL
jgi:hypothetical protein